MKISGISLSLLTLGTIITTYFAFAQWQIDYEQDAQFTIAAKQKGAHVFSRIDSADFDFLHRNNVEWVTLVSWGFQSDYDSPSVGHHNGDSIMIQAHNANWLRRIKSVRAAGFKVFLKPHIWINAPTDGKWRSDIFPKNEADWKQWSENYRDFILRYATLAEQAQAEMFCIGTEFSRLSIEKPAYWRALIEEVRAVYSGKITYAANWYKEYENITFWEDLDYLGIQAYFPLVEAEYPTVEQLSEGWNKYLPIMKALHKKHKRPILFTEMGYKSTSDSAIRPWEWIDDEAVNQSKSFSAETQSNCYAAFFKEVWPKKWFAGVHIWQFREDYLEDSRGLNNLDFIPLGKPAEAIIAKGFE